MAEREEAKEVLTRRYPDRAVIRFGNFFFQANVAHVAMLHAQAMKAGHVVNGRGVFDPWSFTTPPAGKDR